MKRRSLNVCYTLVLPWKIYTRSRIFRYYTGFSFFIFVWISRLEKNEERLLRHETIHFRQQLEMGFVLHWILYVLFYVIARSKGHRHYIAYRYNPFELEAYANDTDHSYLARRKYFAWIGYVRDYRHALTQNLSSKIPPGNLAGW